MGENLQEMKTGELAEKARQAGIDNVEQMDKSEMISALEGKGQGQRYNQPGGGQEQEDPKPRGADPSQYKNVPGNQT
jgi:hypothetical protein